MRRRNPFLSSHNGPAIRALWVASMSIQPFSSDKELLNYASWFLRDRIRAFSKDVDICMTGRKIKGRPIQHAYFPALITCIAFIEFLSGFYAGKLEYQNLSHLREYIEKFFRNR